MFVVVCTIAGALPYLGNNHSLDVLFGGAGESNSTAPTGGTGYLHYERYPDQADLSWVWIVHQS